MILCKRKEIPNARWGEWNLFKFLHCLIDFTDARSHYIQKEKAFIPFSLLK